MTETLTELKQEASTLETELEAKRAKMKSGKLKDFTANVTSLAKVTLKCRKVLVGHLSKVNAFDWDGDSENILSASQDGKLIIWNSHTGLKHAAVPLKSSWVMTCAYCRSDSDFLACGGLDNICTIYRKVGDENPRIKQELLGHEGTLLLKNQDTYHHANLFQIAK
ncbi:hypothetical protein MXB_209 [Myxobolus squamalis]|nr:hypothetical protein MXB_209 [Myxobolus squamalis]